MQEAEIEWRRGRLVILMLVLGAATVMLALTWTRGVESAALSLQGERTRADLTVLAKVPTGWVVEARFLDADGRMHVHEKRISSRGAYKPFAGAKVPAHAPILYAPLMPSLFQFEETLAAQRGDYLVFRIALALALLVAAVLVWLIVRGARANEPPGR
mgnify:CR=1 FL=1|jgi:hypothetical protein